MKCYGKLECSSFHLQRRLNRLATAPTKTNGKAAEVVELRPQPLEASLCGLVGVDCFVEIGAAISTPKGTIVGYGVSVGRVRTGLSVGKRGAPMWERQRFSRPAR